MLSDKQVEAALLAYNANANQKTAMREARYYAKLAIKKAEGQNHV